MQELGQKLKKEREKQKLSLEDIAERTKIHIQKLRDIEEGNWDALPAKVFCVGLVKSYARELKIEMDEVDRLLRLAYASTEEEISESAAPPKPTPSNPHNPSNAMEDDSQNMGLFKVPKTVIIAASLGLSLALLFIIFQVIEKMNSYSQEEQLPKEVFISEEKVEPSEELESSKQTEQAGNNENNSSEPVQTSKPLEKPKVAEVKAEPQPKPIIEVSEEAVANKPEPTKTTNEDFNNNNFGGSDTKDKNKENVSVSDSKLVLTALEPVRAEIVWSDGYVQVMLLKSNETKTLVFSSPITLRVNNGGAIQVSFNDGEKKVPGDFNKPLELRYP